MKKIAIVLMTILAIACTRPQEKDIIGKPQPGQELTITASVPENELPSKTTRDADGKVYWSAAEEISLFYGSGENGGSKFTSTNNVAAKTAQFSGVINVITGVVEDTDDISFWGIYPYNSENSCDGSSATMVIPNIQTSKEGSFSDGVFPSIGRSLGLVMGFYNVCGGFKFQLSQENITSITFRGNNNEVIAGKVKVAFGQDGKPAVTDIVSGEQEIVVTPAGGGAFQTGVDYFIVIRPVTFSQGVTFVFQKADGNQATRVVNASFPINRSQFQHSSSAIDTGVEFISIPDEVDLGLSVKWGSFNVGASTPEEYGDYYAWGEITPYYSSQNPLTWQEGKTDGYAWGSYRWGSSASSLNKYNTKMAQGTFDNKTALELADDVAHVKLGDNWRMASSEEWGELINYCSWSWKTQNTIKGYRVTGPNGNSIFLPAAGFWSNTSLSYSNSRGRYWSSTLSGQPMSAYAGWIDSASFETNGNCPRYLGLSIRPVVNDPNPAPVVHLNKRKHTFYIVGDTVTINATVFPTNSLNKTVEWSSSNEEVATVDSDGVVTAIAVGSSTITACIGTKTETCEVTVKEQSINLGLSVKWSTCNLGATTPGGIGDYYAWGETAPHYTNQNPLTWDTGKSAGYEWASYLWCDGSSTTMTKYTTSDGKSIIDLEDDAAHEKLGGSWRIPTDEEWTELREQCTWTWSTWGGGNGYQVTGPNNNSIFIPIAGYRYGTNVYDSPGTSNESGHYWASSLKTDNSSQAWTVYFYSSSVRRGANGRYNGYSIRPVYAEE